MDYRSAALVYFSQFTMIAWLSRKRPGPIGIDLGSRAVKLVQLSADRTRIVEACRYDFPAVSPAPPPALAGIDSVVASPAGSQPPTSSPASSEERCAQWVAGLKQALEGKAFQGREVIISLGDRDLFLQNIRVPREQGKSLDRLVAQEAAGRLPYGVDEAELRYVEVADVRQGDAQLREVIVFACQKQALQTILGVFDSARLTPLAVDVEPAAIARCYALQYRRDEDQSDRALIVHIGFARTLAVIVQGGDVLFAKYIDVGGSHFDAAIARRLKMEPHEAAALRRHNGDRREELRDPEVTRSIQEALRAPLERLANELAMCVRYHSVTFRGKPLVRMVLGGGEAVPQFIEPLTRNFDLKCELSDPFRGFQSAPNIARRTQWDVAVGLALRECDS